ncbi:MAG TPA: peptide chain release factor N(5)-glutamine methyltransferase [Candidatus Polarisedimenticolia bacterium]|nr:peptide chain release factor N(5)-glutamine methyltransferase [Candidatus Polarisedimenticolia bacterium]
MHRPVGDRVSSSGAPKGRTEESLSYSASALDKDARTMDIRAALKEGMARLRAAQVPSHTLSAELLLMSTLGCDRAWLYTHPEAPLDSIASDKYFTLVARRAAGEPTQYLTGKQEFWGLEFEVTPAVLVPRPETEHVVEVALERLGVRGIKIRMDTGAPSPPLRIADVGTGSGCLAIALARELPHAEIFATDISAAALEVARRNATHHGVSDRIHFLQMDLLEGFLRESPITRHESLPFDLIVSNPPYVARNEAASLPPEVGEHEPETALFGGPTGIEIYAQLIQQAGSLLCAGGILVLELGYGAVDRVRAMVVAQSGWLNISVTNDLAGVPRVLAAERI